ncbi:MAG: class I SAM-dependent methyltransferase [Christensenellales bacterium]|jgi:23S rRNA (cytosine1962-C5)-methyltransferase
MYIADGWKDYELIDCGSGDKFERWGKYTLLRPDPLAIWPLEPCSPHAVYHRSSSGGGHWEYLRPLPEKWEIHYKNLTFIVRPTGFKHTGLFPEQAVNWDWMTSLIEKAAKRPISVLNLFAYTGGATVACLKAGAQVLHLDAAKGMVAWAKDNAAASGVASAPVRYIVDDAMKFVLREARRGRRYDAVIMDPPSYGRGPTGEMWKIEEGLFPLVTACANILSDDPLFFLISSYTTGLAPIVLKNVLNLALVSRYGGKAEAGEVALPCTRRRIFLPCGASGRWTAK